MELSKAEAICIARHLAVQHRQAVYERKSSIGEACEKCPINLGCIENKFELWGNTYRKICESAGVEYSFCKGKYPMVPYEKEDSC